MMKNKMTMEELDLLYKRIASNEFRCEEWPKLMDLRVKVEENPEEHIEFLIWVVETSKKAETKDEKKVEKYINRLLIDTIEIID